MELVIVCMLFSGALAFPAGQTLTFHDDGSYHFHYETGEEGGGHSRSEVRNPDGSVTGKYSYQDPDGEIREVSYRADEAGFVAEGDVGVKGAPKGRFPVHKDRPQQDLTTENPAITEENTVQPSESLKQLQSRPNSNTAVDPANDEVADKGDMQDLSLEEPSALDDPPEGFPPGFFLQKFQGLRRLPEPTKKPTTTTTESPKPPPSTVAVHDEPKGPEQGASTTVQPGQSNEFAPWNRLYGLSPSEWASAMYHQPVYVFSYKQPDSYGYHYFF